MLELIRCETLGGTNVHKESTRAMEVDSRETERSDTKRRDERNFGAHEEVAGCEEGRAKNYSCA